MPQKGFKKDDGVRGRREKISSKVFSFFPDHKATVIGNRACGENMFSDIITIVLLLVFAAVFWIIPKTRSENGNWMIALKTFPLGFIALILSDKFLGWVFWFLSEYRMENISLPFLSKIIISFVAAFAVIIGSGIFIKHRWGTEKRYNPLPSVVLFFAFLVPFIIFCGLLSLALSLVSMKDYHSDWYSIWLKLGTEEHIAFEQQSIHPYLAEYNYRLRFVRDGKVSRRLLFVNTGGKTHFNIYKLQDGRFLFRDKDWDYLVDVSKQDVSVLRTLDKRLYAIPVPNEDVNSWSGLYKIDGKVYMEVGSEKIPANDVTGILDQMKYIGCIRDKFYSAEVPEGKFMEIKHFQKR